MLSQKVKKNLFTSIVVIVSIMATTTVYAQPGGGGGMVSGRVMDKNTGKPLEYANAIIYSTKDSSMVSGTVTGPEGRYAIAGLPFGQYYLELDFIGYAKIFVEGITLSPAEPRYRVGESSLGTSATTLDETVVTADAPMVEYKLDKKVVEVGENISAAGGTAVEALQNVPGVYVDEDGNVSLRGSENFRVLIDGKPAMMSGSDALKQLPAEAIQRIEIITNPSAEYDPDGTTGIINIIMKKRKVTGFNALINLSAGTQDNYTASAMLNYKTEKWNYAASLNYNQRTRRGERSTERDIYYEDSTVSNNSITQNSRSFSPVSASLGVDYSPNDEHNIYLKSEYSQFNMRRKSKGDYLVDNEQTEVSYYTDDDFKVQVDGLQFTLGQIWDMDTTGRRLETKMIAEYSVKDKRDDLYLGQPIEGQGYDEAHRRSDDKESRYRFEADYVHPLSDKTILKAGLVGRQMNTNTRFDVREYYPGTDIWTSTGDSFGTSYFDRSIVGAYSTFETELGGYSIKGGLRGEYTYRVISNQTFVSDYVYESMDLYPSLAISYQLPLDQQLQLSYSRRVDRPRDFLLTPITNFSNGFESFVGNPELEPEFTHSLELNYINKFGKSYFSTEVYYRRTDKMMSRVNSLSSDGLLIMTMDNQGEQDALGTSVNANLVVLPWWYVIPGADVFYYEIRGQDEGRNLTRDGLTWRTNLTNSFRFKTGTMLQLMAFYMGPRVSLDTKVEPFWFSVASVRQFLPGGKASISLSVHDVFNTMTRDMLMTGANYRSETKVDMESRIFMVSFTYNFNNYKYERERGEEGEGGGGGYDMF